MPRMPAENRKTLALLALVMHVPAMSIGNYFVLLAMPGTTVGMVVSLLMRIWLVGFPLVWWLKVERGRLSWSLPRRGGFGIAAALGVIISLIILAAFWWIGRHWVDQAAVKAMAAENHLDRWPIYLLGAVYWCTINSLAEEYVWRWFVFRQFEKLMPGGLAVMAAAAGFTAHHIIALSAYFDWRITALGSLGVFVGGVTWSWLYLRYRSVWPCYVSHAIVDLPIFAIGAWLIFG